MKGFGTSRILAIITFATAISYADMGRGEPDICARLKEISSEDPAQSELNLVWSREEVCRMLYWRKFSPQPLWEILNKDDIAAYERDISNRNCNSAAALLSNRFVAAHPNAPSLLKNTLNFKEWKSQLVGRHFPRLGLCFNLETIRISQDEIERLGLKAEPYAGYLKSMSPEAKKNMPGPVRKRHMAVFSLHRLLINSGRPDIMLALLKLSVDGKAVRYHENYELFFAYRLIVKGRTAHVVDQVIDRPIAANVRSEIRLRAKEGRNVGLPVYPD